MHADRLIYDLALILVVAAIITLIFKKIKQPVVLGYLVAGFLISPNFEVLPTVLDQADITVWGDLGVIFLMFGLGLEFSFKKIATVGGSAFTVAVTVMLSMVLVGAGVGHLLGWTRMNCIFLGGMLSMSSTMIILKAYETYQLKNEKYAQLVLGALVIEDIAGIFMLVILSTISVSKNVSGPEMMGQIIMMLAYLLIWLLVGIYIVPTMMKKIRNLLDDEIIVIVSLAVCLLMVVVSYLIGFSSSLGAFMAGSILAGTVQASRIEALIKPIRDLFGAVFFVSVGMLIEPEMLIEYIGPILILSAVVVVGQMFFSTVGMLLSGQSLEIAVRGGFSMVQIGEFSFIVATLGHSLGVIDQFLYPVIVCVSIITAFITPVMMKLSGPAYKVIEKRLPRWLKLVIIKYTSENQNRNALDADWDEYIKKLVMKVAICSSGMFVVYWLGIKWLEPKMTGLLDSSFYGRIVCVAIILIFMAPFANLMHNTNNPLFVKLWLKHRSNRLPLVTLRAARVVIAACFMALAVKELTDIPFLVLVVIAVIPIILIIRSDFLNGVTIGMEKRFVANFSQRTLERQRVQMEKMHVKGGFKVLNESLYVVEFKIIDVDFAKTIEEITKDRAFMVTIVRIIRDGKFINMPSKDEVVKSGDILHMLGTWDQVDACTMLLEDEKYIQYTDTDDMILKDYILGQTFQGVPEDDQLLCVPVPVKAGSQLILKPIKGCNIRKRFKATIIAIERDNLPIVAPNIDTVIFKDDLLWLMGGQEMTVRLIKGGFMNE